MAARAGIGAALSLAIAMSGCGDTRGPPAPVGEELPVGNPPSAPESPPARQESIVVSAVVLAG